MKQKRIAVVSLGTRGDVDPALALALGLRQAGYDIVFGAPLNFEKEVRAEGLEYRPFRVDMRALMHASETKAFLGAGVLQQIREWRRISHAMDRSAIFDLYEAVKDADAIVFNILLAFAVDIAEVRRIPIMLFALQPVVPTGAFPLCSLPVADLGGSLNRASYDLLRLHSALRRPDLTEARANLLAAPPRPRWKHPAHIDGVHVPSILAASPALLKRPADWPDSARQTGFWFRERRIDWSPDARLAAFLRDGPPPIYVGFGSMPLPRAEESARLFAAALRRAGLRAVVQRGWAEFAPEDVDGRLCIIDDAPHEKLFPMVAAVVHHGGAGTTATGLKAGRPTLVCPVMVDQAFWGRQAAAMGAGPEPLRVKHWSEESLAARLSDLVSNPLYAEGAAKAAEIIRKENGVGDAVEIIRGAFGPP